MENVSLPFELLSNFISVVILIFIFIKYSQYKKKLDVLKGLNELKEKNKLTNEDKQFIKTNLRDYRAMYMAQEARIKVLYPLSILIAGVLLAFLEFAQAMIHLNVIVVAFIYLYVTKLHNKNFATFLEQLNKGLDSDSN